MTAYYEYPGGEEPFIQLLQELSEKGWGWINESDGKAWINSQNMTREERERFMKMAERVNRIQKDVAIEKQQKAIGTLISITIEMLDLEREKSRGTTERGLAEMQANIDPLTGLYNRRKILEILKRSIMVCIRENQPLSLIFVDIDNFKTKNDTLGHHIGDEVLKATSKTMSENLRSTDMMAHGRRSKGSSEKTPKEKRTTTQGTLPEAEGGRYGGEELIAVVPGADAEASKVVAEKIRMGIEKLPPFKNEDTPDVPSLPTTVSLGIATITADELQSLNERLENRTDLIEYIETILVRELLEKADKGLYFSKGNKKNRSTHYNDLPKSR